MRFNRFIAVCMVGALALAACGDDDDDSAASDNGDSTSEGSEQVVRLWLNGPVVVRLPPKSRARRGEVLKLAVDTAAVHLFDPHTGERL